MRVSRNPRIFVAVAVLAALIFVGCRLGIDNVLFGRPPTAPPSHKALALTLVDRLEALQSSLDDNEDELGGFVQSVEQVTPGEPLSDDIQRGYESWATRLKKFTDDSDTEQATIQVDIESLPNGLARTILLGRIPQIHASFGRVSALIGRMMRCKKLH